MSIFFYLYFCVPHLLVDTAVRGSVVDEDADDVHVTSPGGQVQREAAFAVGHIRGRLELQQLQHHVPAGDARCGEADQYVSSSQNGGMKMMTRGEN